MEKGSSLTKDSFILFVDFIKSHEDHNCFEGASIHQIFEGFVEFYQEKKKKKKWSKNSFVQLAFHGFRLPSK
jgi:hypothetical protein